jgi:outer membrane cobalamin receptor
VMHRPAKSQREDLSKMERLSTVAAVALILLVWMTGVIAGPGGRPGPAVTGVVRNHHSGEPIPNANVSIDGTVLGGATDNLGRFRITGVPPGTYNLSVTVVGFKKETRPISVAGSEDVHLSIELRQAAIPVAPVVVTAARREQDPLDVPVSFSVVTAADISKRSVSTPEEALRHASGVTVNESQVGVRGSSGFNRGAGSRLLLLVDGVPALAGDTGDIRWDLIPPDQIQRIEIVKSASSSLYGSSALGGVINIVTRPISESPATSVRLSAGYFDDPYYPEWKWTSQWLTFSGIDVSHSRRIGNIGFLTAFGKKSSDGYRRNSDFDRLSATAKLTYACGQSRLVTCFIAWAVDKYGHSTEWESQADALDIDVSAWHDRTRSEKLTGYIKLRNITGPRGILSGTLSWYHTDWDNDFHDAKDSARALKLGGSVQLDRIIRPGIESTMGIEGSHTGVTSTMFNNRQTWDIGAFMEARLRISGNMSVSAGARYDTHRLSDDRPQQGLLSPRAALVVRTGTASSFNVSVGRGFRAPTVAEMFTSTSVGGFTVKPNLGLSSESGITYEAGWMGDIISVLRTGLGVFRSDYSDLIEPAIDQSDGNIHFTNIHDAHITGFEGWITTAPVMDRLSLTSSYMYLSTEDERTGQALAYRSRHNVKASLDAAFGGASAGLDFVYRSRVERVKVYEADQRVPIYVTDLRGDARLGHLRLSAKISNLFQYNYTEIERTLAPIRYFTVNVGATF